MVKRLEPRSVLAWKWWVSEGRQTFEGIFCRYLLCSVVSDTDVLFKSPQSNRGAFFHSVHQSCDFENQGTVKMTHANGIFRMKIVERQDSSYMSLILSFYLGEKKTSKIWLTDLVSLLSIEILNSLKKKYYLYST